MGKQIHESAVIDPSAELADDVEIGPFVVIESGVTLGRGSRVMAHAFIGRDTVVGEENVFHPGAVVGHAPQDISTTGEEKSRVVVGDRNSFREYCTVHRGYRDGTETRIGDDCLIMATAHIAHDCKLGNRVILAGGSLLAGHILVEDYAFISGNVAVHQFCRIGSLAMVAGLARVSRDPPPFFLVKGDSMVYGLNIVGLQRAGLEKQERQEIRGAYKILYRKGLRLEQALARIEAAYRDSKYVRHLVEFIRGSERGICPHHKRGAPRS
ncbi:MAG: acyl-ACP--UDP-N-acetylglucosamine O-acyltransferase [Planctomycetota bacterium]